jgi:hypothetical protein
MVTFSASSTSNIHLIHYIRPGKQEIDVFSSVSQPWFTDISTITKSINEPTHATTDDANTVQVQWALHLRSQFVPEGWS